MTPGGSQSSGNITVDLENYREVFLIAIKFQPTYCGKQFLSYSTKQLEESLNVFGKNSDLRAV